jgi:hypothetical protein
VIVEAEQLAEKPGPPGGRHPVEVLFQAWLPAALPGVLELVAKLIDEEFF